MMSHSSVLNDADRYNNVLQIVMRCCVKIKRKLLSTFASSLGYTSIDQFLVNEKHFILKMPFASSQQSQDLLYPQPAGTPTNIDQWDMSLLNCVFTHIQRKIIIREISNPIDDELKTHKVKVLATSVGQTNEYKLYPKSGKPTNLEGWTMPICSCLLSVLFPRPQPLNVHLAQLFNGIREVRNDLCHTESPEMSLPDYNESLTMLSSFIETGLHFIDDCHFSNEMRQSFEDIINGKMKSFLLEDHIYLKKSYDRDQEITKRLENVEKEVKELKETLQNNNGDLTLLVFFANLRDEQKQLLYSTYLRTFLAYLKSNTPQIEDEENEDLKLQIIHASCKAWAIFNNPFEGRTVLGAKKSCFEVKLGFDSDLWMWKFIKDYLSGRLDTLFNPIQTDLRNIEGFESTEVRIILPNVFNSLGIAGVQDQVFKDNMLYVAEVLYQCSLSESLQSKGKPAQSTMVNQGTQTTLGTPLSTSSHEDVKKGTDYTMKATAEETNEHWLDEFGPSLKPNNEDLPENVTERPAHCGKEAHVLREDSRRNLQSYICESCSKIQKKVLSKSFCTDCKEAMCDECAQAHTKEHKIIPKGRFSKSTAESKLQLTVAPSIQIKSPSDVSDCWFTGMVLLPEHKLLLADFDNLSIMLVDLQLRNVLFVLKLSDKPWDMCLLANGMVAVTIAHKAYIQLLKVDTEVSLAIRIEVNGNCRGIAYYEDSLIISYQSGDVEKLHLNGTVIKTLSKNSSKFSRPFNLTAVSVNQEGAIYVSDYFKNRVTKLDMELNILQIFSHSELEQPMGMTVVDNCLLICARETGKIICLDMHTDKLCPISAVEGVTPKPRKICFSPLCRQLFVLCGEAISDGINEVQVYNAS